MSSSIDSKLGQPRFVGRDSAFDEYGRPLNVENQELSGPATLIRQYGTGAITVDINTIYVKIACAENLVL